MQRRVGGRLELMAAGGPGETKVAWFAGPRRSFEPPAGVLRFLDRRAARRVPDELF